MASLADDEGRRVTAEGKGACGLDGLYEGLA
jgi:hypothetical protein